ncbi:hypothetical protein [Sphingomicrobium nitratireducens]|uniref:hypothetical protein n=1 Tax=Sphingomicrobium nitratireducens TaxID=2964666 RepID=UPI002240DBAA|nr:hypothetical protein [Sphingomicrobium nitratireducens]
MILAALLLAASEPASEPASVIDAERAFAADAQEFGQWTAFAKWAREDGVLVGRSVVNAKEFAGAQENPAQALRWWPVRSFQSCDGKMAVNIGGWEDPESGHAGRFHTVWSLGEEGWRYVVDLGATGAAALPDTGGVEIERATCRNRENAAMDKMAPPSLDPLRGASDDGTLLYVAGVGPDGDKHLMITLWDGDHPERVYVFETPRGKPAQ